MDKITKAERMEKLKNWVLNYILQLDDKDQQLKYKSWEENQKCVLLWNLGKVCFKKEYLFNTEFC